MIIWGSKGREVVEKSGSFYCPACGGRRGFELTRVSKYFTLYFIPVFQMKELGRYVECKSCQTKFKETVLRQESKAPVRQEPTIDPEPSQNPNLRQEREIEQQEFSRAAELVSMQINAASMLYEDELQQITDDQHQRLLAFELGVIEYVSGALLQIDAQNPGAKYGNFLLFCANYKYGELSEQVFEVWTTMAAHGLNLRERELGFDSVNDQENADGTKREGHFPGGYLKEAVGI